MSKNPIKESDIPSSLSHINSLAERCGSVVENTCDACQNSPGSILSRAGFRQHCQRLHYKELLLIYRMDKIESSEEVRPVNKEIDLTVGEVVTDQAEAMSTGKHSLVPGLFNQNSSVNKTLVTYHHILLRRV